MTDIKEAQGLEVVGYVAQDDIDFKGDCTLRIGAYSDYTIPVVRLSDATAVIDQQARRIELLDEANRQLRERVAELEEDLIELGTRYAETFNELAALKSAPVVMPEWATSYEALGQRLLDAGWRDYADAQWDGVKEIFAELNRSIFEQDDAFVGWVSCCNKAMAERDAALAELAALKAQEPSVADWPEIGLPPAGSVCEARIPHHTSEGRQMIWTEVEVLAHALVEGVPYSWVKETGSAGSIYAPMMLSFRTCEGRKQTVKQPLTVERSKT